MANITLLYDGCVAVLGMEDKIYNVWFIIGKRKRKSKDDRARLGKIYAIRRFCEQFLYVVGLLRVYNIVNSATNLPSPR